MTDKELRRLSRKGLLEILIAQTKETEKYKAQVQSLEAELDEYKRSYSEIGSLAGEALKVSGVYEAAQKAADKYLEEISRLREEALAEREDITEKAEAETQAEKERIISEAQAEKERIIENAKAEADALMNGTKKALNKKIKDVNEYAAKIKARIDAYIDAHPEVRNQSDEQENSESESEDE